ncbi:hypothetical protein BVX95_00345 [archaeon D22]|nr:hypothetical protein BVX95_00345 [archaeon D22]
MNVYEEVTNRIIEIMEQGEVPWRKPWVSAGGAKNLVSKKPYRGINQFLLNCAPYGSPYWLTFKQASERGGKIRKGEKSTLVVFWKWIEPKDTDNQDGTTTKGKIPLLRYYRVFNLDQTEGITPHPAERPTNPFTPIESAEQIISSVPLKPDIRYGGDRAYYSPHTDAVTLPPKEAFHSPEEFYATYYHELSHATGHQKRLGRKGITETSYFGSHLYSQEELVAELGASMLCGVTGIEQQTIENSAAYIQGWLKVLRGDKKLLVHAAAQAQRAADFILNGDPEDH